MGLLPLTLALSPQAGRGDVPYERSLVGETGAAYPLRPVYGEKVAGRPNEGPRDSYPFSTARSFSALVASTPWSSIVPECGFNGWPSTRGMMWKCRW